MSDFSISSSVPGFPAPTRKDILFEGLVTLDSSGNFKTPWFDTAGVTRVTALAQYGPLSAPLTSISIHEAWSNDGVNPIDGRSVALGTFGAEGGYGELTVVAARFVNVNGVGGSVNANGEFFLTIRGT